MILTRRTALLTLGAFGLAACSTGGGSGAPANSTGGALPADLRPTPNAAYDAWVRSFRGRAGAQGLSDSTLAAGFRGTGYLPGVVKRDRNQVEFSRTLEDYLSIAASDERVSKGRAAYSRHRDTLAAVEKRYGVAPEIVTAIW
ncbi:lytic murein transglycosylase, partial [Tateyamaria sp.]